MRDLGGRPAEYRVFGLVDTSTGKLAYIGFDRRNKPPRWHTIWAHRDRLDTELARFLKSQSKMPAEVVLLGAGVGLHRKVARAACDLLRGMVPGLIQGRKTPGRRRPVAQVQPDGSLRVWPSQAAAGTGLENQPLDGPKTGLCRQFAGPGPTVASKPAR